MYRFHWYRVPPDFNWTTEALYKLSSPSLVSSVMGSLLDEINVGCVIPNATLFSSAPPHSHFRRRKTPKPPPKSIWVPLISVADRHFHRIAQVNTSKSETHLENEKMLGQEIKEDVEEPTVSELVTTLKSAFQTTYFTRVEEALMSREERLKREIEGKDRENRLLVEKLQRVQKECGEWKELALKRVKESEDYKKEIIELKWKMSKVQCDKIKAESELDVLTGKFVVLERQVLCLEKDSEMLDRLEKSGGEVDPGMELELELELEMGMGMGMEKDGVVNVPMDTNAGKTRANGEAENRLNVVEETRKFDSDERPETNPNPSGGSSHRKRAENQRPSSKDIIEILDSDDESTSPESAKGTVTEEHLHKMDSGKNEPDSGEDVSPAVLKKTSASPMQDEDGRPIEIGKQSLGENVIEIGPTETYKRDSENNAAEIEPVFLLKRTSNFSVEVNDSRSTGRGTRDLKNITENEPAVVKRTSVSSVDVEDIHPTERGKRVKNGEHVPFAFPVGHRSPSLLNFGTLHTREGNPSPELSKPSVDLDDDSSSSSSLDDDDDMAFFCHIKPVE
ncbi:hypothetical protein M5689_008266 [Euphorbia peplus]|nr:hypothetical protein M5689_008266 [Euphorbia peplus]